MHFAFPLEVVSHQHNQCDIVVFVELCVCESSTSLLIAESLNTLSFCTFNGWALWFIWTRPDHDEHGVPSTCVGHALGLIWGFPHFLSPEPKHRWLPRYPNHSFWPGRRHLNGPLLQLPMLLTYNVRFGFKLWYLRVSQERQCICKCSCTSVCVNYKLQRKWRRLG